MYNKWNLVKYCKSKIGKPYLYGFKQNFNFDIKCTEMHFNYLRKLYPKYIYKSDKIKCVGNYPCDCSGLISAYLEKQYSSTEFYNKSVDKLPLTYNNLLKMGVGSLIWKKGHIGVISQIGVKKDLSDSYYISEDGSAFGCRKAKIKDSSFTTILKLDNFSNILFTIKIVNNKKPCFKLIGGKRIFYKKLKAKKYNIVNVITIKNINYGVTEKNNLIKLNKKGYIVL